MNLADMAGIGAEVFAGCLFALLAIRAKNALKGQKELAGWLGELCLKAGVFDNPKIDEWTDQWFDSEHNRIFHFTKSHASTIIHKSNEFWRKQK